MKWRCLAPGKLNLSLFVGAPRADGYHPLISVFQPVSLADELVLEPGEDGFDEVVCPGVEGENLVSRAIAAFRDATGWDGPPVRITIAKRIPIAAGMGGGSADAAAALRLLMAVSRQRPDDLVGLATRLGADVPSQLVPQRSLVQGIGERVERLPGAAPYAFVVVPSRHALSTPDVYAELDLGRRGGGPREDELVVDLFVRTAGRLVNDLEAPAMRLYPPLRSVLADVREARGTRQALVSGSGRRCSAATTTSSPPRRPPGACGRVTPARSR